VRNEEEHIARALQSVCEQDYTHYRVLVINDRSIDKTPEVLQQLSARYPHLQIVHITGLPDGWLGKNFAMYSGAASSSEEFILFTDADVLFEKDTVRKAMRFVTHHTLDHLTIIPFVNSRSGMLNGILSTFTLMLELRQKPWAVSDPESNAFLGIGAFNLVRRTAYEKGGTHQAIRMRPDDDLKLAEQIKLMGGRSNVLYGDRQLSLEWYPSIKEFVSGLMKNTYAVFQYNPFLLIFTGVIPAFFTVVFPLPALIFTGGWINYILLIAVGLSLLPVFMNGRGIAGKWWHLFAMPVAGLLFIYIMIRAFVITDYQRGLYWRGSFYSLQELRKNIR
jgi:glycosyltransferase involved in cell wall biosynthesis